MLDRALDVIVTFDKTLRLEMCKSKAKSLSDLDAYKQRVLADSSASEQPLYKETRKVVVIETGDSTCHSKAQVEALIYCEGHRMTHTTTGILEMSHNKVLGYKLPEQ